MDVEFELVSGIYTLSGKAWAEKPDRAVGLGGSFQFQNLTIKATDAHNTEVPVIYLEGTELNVLADFGFCVDKLEQEAYEQWQGAGYG